MNTILFIKERYFFIIFSLLDDLIKVLKFNLFILFVIFTFKYKQSMEEAKGLTRTVATA